MSVTDETDFLKLLDEQPGDNETRLVYADWLEEHGELQRAQVLRGIVALDRIPYDDDKVVREARKLLKKSRGLYVEWLERVSHPRLDGSAWGLRDGGSREYLLGFLPDGKLHYKRSDDQTWGTWGQVGRALWFAINDYSSHEGVFTDDRIQGEAANEMRMTWSIRGVRLDPKVLADPDMPPLPEELVDTPYVDNTRMPRGAPRPRERVTAKGVVWWVRRPKIRRRRPTEGAPLRPTTKRAAKAMRGKPKAAPRPKTAPKPKPNRKAATRKPTKRIAANRAAAATKKRVKKR